MLYFAEAVQFNNRKNKERNAIMSTSPENVWAADVLMAKYLFASGTEMFRLRLPRPIKNYTKETLRDIGLRTAIPTDLEKKHFVVRTACGKCYRIEHEGIGSHMWSIHLCKNAGNDPYALHLLSINEVCANEAVSNQLVFA